MQGNESNESDKPAQDEQIREYGQVVLKANAGKHRIFLLSIIGEVEGHEQSPGNVKTTKYEHVLPQLAMAEDSCDIDGILVLLNTMGGDVLDAMLTHEVSGGGVDSYERLGTAVRMSLEKLSAVPAGERVLMLFTDSSPTDEDLERVFCRNETPIRSAVLFVPTAYSGSEYMFRMVDADGKTDRAKTAVVFDIEDVIKERYLKTVTEKNGRRVMDDNQLLKNQLLMALA